MNRASLSETMTSHRWQTIGQQVTFNQAAKTRGKQKGVCVFEREKGEKCLLSKMGEKMTLKERKKHQKFTWIDETSLMSVKYKTRATVVLKSDFQCFCVCFCVCTVFAYFGKKTEVNWIYQ